MAEEKFDCIVIGAGPSGIAAAYTMARAGLKVIVIERGDYPGSKNMFGGVLYSQPTALVIPQFWREAPIERHVSREEIWFLAQESATVLGHRSEEFHRPPYNKFTVQRAKFDKWFARKAEEAGALLITETVVEDLLYEGDQVVGIRAGREEGELFADCVILADGVTSLLAIKAGMRKDWPVEDSALAVKEVLALPREKVEDRFNLEEGEGASIELVGQLGGMEGVGQIYTNKDTISIVVGAVLADFVRSGIRPYELIDQIKAQPQIQRLIKGAELREYSAHLIPEGGFHRLSRLVGNGILVVGDAAGFLNALFWEGSNLAMLSGKFAGETVIQARQYGDFSKRFLMKYEDKIKKSFIWKDMRRFNLIPRYLRQHPHIFAVYPEILNDVAHEFFQVDGTPKERKLVRLLEQIGARRPYWRIAMDLVKGGRSVL